MNDTFLSLVETGGAFVLGIAGFVDGFLVKLMAFVGIADPRWQLFFLLVIFAVVVAVIMRKLGGLFGWLALLLAAVLVLHFVVPGLGMPS
ncbi:MAG: hypothetical protein KGQ79_06345 [Proteobacteria bacterium]|nr:hypothetical protein [Pseudomonadota bacterium]MBU6425953.1 hypothetical protein [Rhodospirillales bacterium]